MAQLLSNMNAAIVKVPLGFIRVIEFPMAILAFATTSGYGAKGSLEMLTDKFPGCSPKNPVYPIEFGYPFDLTDDRYRLPKNFCNDTSSGDVLLFSQGFISSSQFFVFTGVISFLYILAILIVYLLLWANYESDPRFPTADFIVTAVFALFWFIGSCAWASGVSGLKDISSFDAVNSSISKIYPCGTSAKICQLNAAWNYASLNVSLIAGFACTALWVANLWFIYKETTWFKARSGGVPPAGPAAAPHSSMPGGQPTYR